MRKTRASIFALTVLSGFFAAERLCAQTWLPNIPDTYQHQRWGAKPGQAVPGAPGGVPGAADPDGDSTWEANYTPATATDPEKVGFYGQCFQASTVNQLYYFRQRGFTTFGPNNPANATTLHNEVKPFEAAYNAAPGNTVASINKILNDRGAGTDKGVGNGLLSQNFKQVGNQVKYISATGAQSNLGKNTLYEHVKTIFGKEKDAVNLRLAYPFALNDRQGTPQEGLWWAGLASDNGNFHNVTVAGFDANTLYFADPDTNPVNGRVANGNRNVDGGWTTSVARWKAAAPLTDDTDPATAGLVKQKRFLGAAGVPKPAGAAPTAAEQAMLYLPGTLDPNKKEFKIANADFNRYDAVQIRYLETMEVMRANNKPAPVPPSAPGMAPGLDMAASGLGPYTFQVSPTLESTNLINQFFLFPGLAIEELTTVALASPWSSSWAYAIHPACTICDPMDPMNNLYTDLWGNVRPLGGVEMFTTNGSIGSLIGAETLEFDYTTAGGGPLSAWDFVYNDSFDTSGESLGVQVFGGLAGYELATEQLVPVPEPTSAALLVLFASAVALAAGRRQRPEAPQFQG